MPIIAAIAVAATITAEIMAKAPSQNKKSPWPSLDAASWLFDRSSFVLIGSLAFGAIATFLIVWMGIVKERHWEILREASNERIAELNKDTASLKADAEASKAKIAEADARASEAQLELKKFKSPRHPTKEQLLKMVEQLKPFAGTKFDGAVGPAGDPEPIIFFDMIATILTFPNGGAGWVQIDFSVKNVGTLALSRPGKPFVGLSLVTNVIIDTSPSAPQLKPAAMALVEALKEVGIDAAAEEGVGDANSPNTDAVHIMIGRKI